MEASSVASGVARRTGRKLTVAGGTSEPTEWFALSPPSGNVETIADDASEVVVNGEGGPGDGEAMEFGAGRLASAAFSCSGEANGTGGGVKLPAALVTAGNSGCANAANKLSVALLEDSGSRACDGGRDERSPRRSFG